MAQLVERRGAQLGDQALQVANGQVHVLDRAIEGGHRRARSAAWRTDSSATLNAPSSWRVSSCSSRAQRVRSFSAARIDSRRRSATDWAVAMAMAALDAKDASRCWSSVETRIVAQAVERDQHALPTAPEPERHHEGEARIRCDVIQPVPDAAVELDHQLAGAGGQRGHRQGALRDLGPQHRVVDLSGSR